MISLTFTILFSVRFATLGAKWKEITPEVREALQEMIERSLQQYEASDISNICHGYELHF
jgi:ClpP class serine protease